MFPLDCESSLTNFIASKNWTLLSTLSFEERCLGFPRLATQLHVSPISAHYMIPVHKGSEWESPCNLRQNKLKEELICRTGWDIKSNDADQFELSDPNAAAIALNVLEDICNEIEPVHLIIDITTMPNNCLFPLIRTALLDSRIKTIAVVYSEPQGYSPKLLRSDPQPPIGLRSFNYLVPGSRTPVGWIPILGFGSFFGSLIYDSIMSSFDLYDRVFPILGFPAFNPTLFDRMLLENVGGFLAMFQGHPAIGTQLLYSPAADPFLTKRTIQNAVKNFSNIHWIGSPLGPKPMALGMALAAVETEMTILDCQARSYHPDYSHGCRSVHMYVIK